MSNIHYFLVSPDPSIRKKILKSQYNLLKHEKKLLYEEEPLKLGVLQCLVHRKRISEFLDKTVREFPALSDIEALKAQETLHNYTRIKSMLYYWTVGLSCFLGAYSILRPEFDWVYQQKVFYSKFSKSNLLQRALFGGFFLLVLANSKNIREVLLTGYYSDLLANLQIGEEFELGHLSREFVSSLVNN